MIELNSVSFSYYVEKGLDDINLEIKDGEAILLCGSSGCGKTTITRLINGLIPHYFEGRLNGEVMLNNKKISDIPLYKISFQIGSVFQNPRSQFFNVDTTSELAFGCENQGMDVKEIHRRINNTIQELNIEKLVDRSIFNLSGGEKQKIACASVSTMGPEVYVLDEPSSNLDAKSIEDLGKIISLWKNKGKTVIIAEHRLHYLMNIVDRVIYLDKGKIVFDMTIDKFKEISDDKLKKIGLRTRDIKKCFDKKEYIQLHTDKKVVLKDFKYLYEDKQVLNIPELNVPEGAIIAVLGNNGAGKTTFAKYLCGLISRTKGILQYKGKNYTAKQRLNLCYMVMQDVNHQLFTEDVLSEILLSMGNDDEESQERAKEILKSLNLSEYIERHPMSLSGGQKQRVAIGSAIAANKEIIVFDEPTSGLDYRHMIEVSENIRTLNKLGKTIFIITHDPELVSICCNYFIFMESGCVTRNGSLNDTNSEFIKNFFEFSV